MGLENNGVHDGRFLNSLDENNPASTDALSQADEHLKYIKGILLNSFPSVTGAITGTHTAINAKVAEPVSAITSDGSAPSLNTAAGVTAANLKTLLGVDGVAITTATDSGGEVTPVLATGITALEIWNLVKASALNSIYPIGAIYTAITSGSPETVFGGTWQSFGQGRVLVGHDDAASPDSDFVASSTDGSSVLVGGVKTYSTNVTVPRDGWGNEQDGSQLAEPTPAGHLITGDGTSDNQNFNNLAIASGDRTFTTATFSSLQPYVVVYMWKRTA
jgi:hypothetical protein